MRFSLLACALLSTGLLSGPADARSRERGNEPQRQEPRREEPREQRQQPDLAPEGWRDGGGSIDRSGAARRAQQRNGGGRVLSVDPDGSGYRVKVLKDGEVRTHHVDDDNN